MRAAPGAGHRHGLEPGSPREGDAPAAPPHPMGDGAAGAGDSRTVRGLNEPPNPLILFLAREMGLFSPSRLLWGEEIVGKRGFSEKMGVLRLGGKRKPRDGGHGLSVSAPCASQDGERCPVCPAQGGESHGQVPLPRQVQTPQGTAALGTGPQREPSSRWSSGVSRRDKDPLGWLGFEPQTPKGK